MPNRNGKKRFPNARLWRLFFDFFVLRQKQSLNKKHFIRLVLRFIRNFARHQFFPFFERKLALRLKELGRIQYTFLDEIPKK